jgi:hypothetical protein
MLSKNVVVSWALELELLKSRLKEDAPHNGNMFEECGVPETATSASYCGGQSENGDASSAQADDDSLELEEYQDFIFVAINNNRLTRAMFLGFSPMSRSSFFVKPLSTIPSKQGVESNNNWKGDRTTTALSSAGDRRETTNDEYDEYDDELDEYERSIMVEANMVEADKFEEEIIDGLRQRDSEDQTFEISNISPSGSASSPTLAVADTRRTIPPGRMIGKRQSIGKSNAVLGCLV